MYKIPLADLREKIVGSGKITAPELETRIKAKINELSGLISEEGAAHIIANELAISLVSAEQNLLKIKEVYTGMRNISTIGKVVRKFDVREFAKGDKTGKVCSLVLGDETGSIRVVFWNDQVEQLAGVQEEDVVRIDEAYVRENNGGKEIHLGDKGSIEVNPEGVTINAVRQGNSFERKQISELGSGEEGVELMGTVVQVFDPRFFEVHPETGKKIQPGENVTPAYSYVLNLILDDGTGNIRCVFWKNQVTHLVGKKEEEILQFKENPAQFENIKTDLLGEQFKLMGRVKKNDMFDRLEFNVQLVEKAKPEEEAAKLNSTE